MSLGEKQGIFYLLLILLFASSAVFSFEVRAWKIVARVVRERVVKEIKGKRRQAEERKKRDQGKERHQDAANEN